MRETQKGKLQSALTNNMGFDITQGYPLMGPRSLGNLHVKSIAHKVCKILKIQNETTLLARLS